MMGLFALSIDLGQTIQHRSGGTGIQTSIFQFNTADAAEKRIQPWRFAVSSGTIRYRPLESTSDADWRDAVSGDIIPGGMQIQAGRQSHALLTNGHDSIRLQSKSSIALPENSNATDILVMQNTGKVFYKVKNRRKPALETIQTGTKPKPAAFAGEHFEVYTRYLVAIVKGTGFSVSVTSEQATISVSEGIVGITDVGSGDSADLSAGQSASAGAGGLIVADASGGGGETSDVASVDGDSPNTDPDPEPDPDPDPEPDPDPGVDTGTGNSGNGVGDGNGGGNGVGSGNSGGNSGGAGNGNGNGRNN